MGRIVHKSPWKFAGGDRLRLVPQKPSPVIPGRRDAASPESIIPVAEYGFRVRGLAPAPRNDGSIAVAGVDLVADLSGALYWPKQSLLVVADLHLEKGSAFARRGMLLPPYDTAATLARLAAAIDRYAPRAVVALGDSFHDGGGAGRLGADDRAALAALQRGRDWVWIAGNHDPDPAGNIGGMFAQNLACGPLTFRHEPTAGNYEGEIAGHLHPCARVSQRGRTMVRRCFAGDSRRLVMPAFGAYAGGLSVRDRAFLAVFGALAFTAHLLGDRRLYAVAAARCLA
jgi:DNA ligase-associated metallophosphoesterase